MQMIRFIKSFNKGQVTIPKEIRDSLGILNEFWLKVYVDGGRIIAEPVEQEKDKASYAKKLLGIKGDWFNANDIKKNRKQLENQISARVL